MTPRWMAVLFSALLASAANAAPGNTDVVRDLASRVGVAGRRVREQGAE